MPKQSPLLHWNEAWDKDSISLDRVGEFYEPRNEISRALLLKHAGVVRFHERDYDRVLSDVSFAGLCLETPYEE